MSEIEQLRETVYEVAFEIRRSWLRSTSNEVRAALWPHYLAALKASGMLLCHVCGDEAFIPPDGPEDTCADCRDSRHVGGRVA